MKNKMLLYFTGILAAFLIPAAVSAALVNNGNGTVTDDRTGLTWQQAEVGSMLPWVAALSYCEALSLAGATDWRLPNVKELESITDDTRVNPAIDTNYFPNAVSSLYWSSTTYMELKDRAWYVSFTAGSVNNLSKTSSYYVRCVRGGQSGPTPVGYNPQWLVMTLFILTIAGGYLLRKRKQARTVIRG